MCADRDSPSSPGLRALLGRLLHGLLQLRVFQLLGAAWSYLMGLPSFFSFLPSAWLLHRSVGPDELPEVLEALGLRPGPWEGLEELGPWKELLSPTMKADLEMMHPWTGYVSSSKEQETWEELGSWHTKVQALWEPGLGTWKEHEEDEDDDECCSRSSDTNEMGLGDGTRQSPLDMVSCIFNPGSPGVFTWIDLGSDASLQDKDVLDNPSKSKVEIEHIRNMRLWFLQQNQDVPSGDAKKVSDLTDPALLRESDPAWHDGHNKDLSPDHHLLSDHQSSVVELPGTDPDSQPCHPLSLLVPKPDISGNTQDKYLPTPDQDQGYHSLEDWQCINLTQHLQSGGISPPDIGPADSVVKDREDDEDSDDMDSDLEEDIRAPAIPVCTNKHIGYILGTVVSDEEEDPGSSCEDDDDGFDSEGSVSASESDIPVPEEGVLWTSFCSADPYNPQNFTASLQTGPVAEVSSHLEEQDAVSSDDEESWCDSDAVSDSDSEEEYSADEQENLKLWNGFLKSEDPYNPLFFTASVQTFEQKRQNSDAATKLLELVCTSPSSCELTVRAHPNDSWPLRVSEKRCGSEEQRANSGHKKVTFYEKITIYYVCNEERKGHWEEYARDRCRFQRRIRETEAMIGHCFTPDHRQRVWNRMQEIWDS
ncbi:hypothetical protein GDO78_008528 [Eleutherodactylus coqui]|uniref:Protein phosphatase 1 regulatory subunit 15A/B C-terminal domain-containing protein n=1 Tax=Eleutherodactylus coqui TaxID=57060 RepID=A0A8J6K993_ELECQ|nr:hypothetical protein GDO78_008528 [Eleutherodactylus coqui]